MLRNLSRSLSRLSLFLRICLILRIPINYEYNLEPVKTRLRASQASVKGIFTSRENPIAFLPYGFRVRDDLRRYIEFLSHTEILKLVYQFR